MNIINTTVPVVILKAHNHGALGIARSLGVLGIPVYAVDGDPGSPINYSRYCRDNFVWDIDNASAVSSVAFLRRVADTIGTRAILVPTSDATAVFVAEQAPQLRDHFVFPDQPAELVRSLCSKESMYYLAKRHGIPTAETVFPRTRADVVRFLDTTRFPVMLKSIDGSHGTHVKKSGKYIVRSAREVLDIYDRVEDPNDPNLMMQEYIPGGEDTIWMFNGYFDANSDCVVGFTGKKIRQCPVYTGVTSLGVCISNPVVEETTRRFMKTVGYCGILDIGYRYDARDGFYKVLDVNPRIGATFRLFVSSDGMDVARALYMGMNRECVHARTAPEGRKWLVEDFDLVSCFRYYRDRKLGFRDWLSSYRGVQETAFFRFDDPVPALARLRLDLYEAARRIRVTSRRRKNRRPAATTARN